MLTEAYRTLMDPSVNPLRALPKLVQFQYMLILSYMWSAVFALWIGYTWLMGPSLLAHSVLLIGVFYTVEIFTLASRRPRAVRAESRTDCQ
ncbi:MAG: hypothetical protein AAF405_08735 [Pseudomonadota bacterium]